MKFEFTGLDPSAVEAARREHGNNAITTQETETFLDKLRANLRDPIIIILIVALVITIILAILGFSPWYEGVGIAIAVALATLISTWSEYSNESAFQRLLEEASMIQVRVFRGGRLLEIPINELVVGDDLLLKPGDNVPADGYLVAGALAVQEAALTGESEPLKKTAVTDGETPERKPHALFRASLVDDGEAVMRVTAVGDRTEYGKTMREVLSAEDRLSPLQQKLSVLGGHISTFGYIGAPFIALAFMFNHIFLQNQGFAAYASLPVGEIIADIVTALTLGIIIIVVAVPEGLPMMIAIVLSMNMKRLLHGKVLVRKLLGIETAGSLTVLFTDKTGTLTRGELTAASFLMGDGTQVSILNELPASVRNLLGFALRNNTGAVIDASDPEHPGIVGADRTEAALLRFLGPDLLIQDASLEVLGSIAFNSSRKFSATQVGGARSLTLVKGAPEVLLAQCQHYHDGETQQPLDRAALEASMNALTGRAMRLLAVAVSDTPLDDSGALPQNLSLLGIFGLRDELRPESTQGVADAQSAGIQVVMITGDAQDTAEAIARDAGLLDIPDPQILSSEDLNALEDDAVKAILPKLRVVARAFPTDKSRLVRLAKEIGWVVGMTGDGVNDAPAVKNADVGFAMGSGTEMTKESSDIVILDDNFASLTRASLYGRTLFKSIRKFLVFQLTVNVSAILLAFLGPFVGHDLPLTMVQLLWINIIMDTLAALAFSGEPALHRYMREPPISREAPLITRDMWSAILIDGIAATILSLVFLSWPPIRGLFHSEAAFLTGFFGFFVFLHNFNKFNARTENIHLGEHLSENRQFLGVIALIFGLQVIFTYLGGDVLRTVALYPSEWVVVVLLAALIIPVDLLRKWARNRWFGNPVVDEPEATDESIRSPA